MKWQPIITTDSMRVISETDKKNHTLLVTEKDNSKYIMRSINREEMLILENMDDEILPFLNNDYYMMIEKGYQMERNNRNFFMVFFGDSVGKNGRLAKSNHLSASIGNTFNWKTRIRSSRSRYREDRVCSTSKTPFSTTTVWTRTSTSPSPSKRFWAAWFSKARCTWSSSTSSLRSATCSSNWRIAGKWSARKLFSRFWSTAWRCSRVASRPKCSTPRFAWRMCMSRSQMEAKGRRRRASEAHLRGRSSTSIRSWISRFFIRLSGRIMEMRRVSADVSWRFCIIVYFAENCIIKVDKWELIRALKINTFRWEKFGRKVEDELQKYGDHSRVFGSRRGFADSGSIWTRFSFERLLHLLFLPPCIYVQKIRFLEKNAQWRQLQEQHQIH